MSSITCSLQTITGETQTHYIFSNLLLGARFGLQSSQNSGGWNLGTIMFANTPINSVTKCHRPAGLTFLWKFQLACEASLNICAEVLRSMDILCCEVIGWWDLYSANYFNYLRVEGYSVSQQNQWISSWFGDHSPCAWLMMVQNTETSLRLGLIL